MQENKQEGGYNQPSEIPVEIVNVGLVDDAMSHK